MISAKRRLDVWKMGLVKYADAHQLQNECVEQRRLGIISDTLISLQHPPTFTLGKRRTSQNILSSPSKLQQIGAEVHYTDRGGDATFHGPHQAVLYPILSLRELRLGVRRYVEGLEDTMIKLAALYGVDAKGRILRETGVWVEDRKIGAVGVKISGGISSHGLAFNIDPDLSFFSHIVPCGIPNKLVTSLKRESSLELANEGQITQQLIECFVDVFAFEEIELKENQ